jgi:hypothetical protein
MSRNVPVFYIDGVQLPLSPTFSALVAAEAFRLERSPSVIRCQPTASDAIEEASSAEWHVPTPSWVTHARSFQPARFLSP